MSKEKLIAYFLLKLLRHAGEKTLANEITESKFREKEFSSVLIAEKELTLLHEVYHAAGEVLIFLDKWNKICHLREQGSATFL